MKAKFTFFLEKYGQAMGNIMWAITIAGVIFFLAYLFTTGTVDQKPKANIWFLAILASYMLINTVTAESKLGIKASVLLIESNLIMAGLLVILGILRYFIFLPMYLKIISGWWIAIGIIILLILAIRIFLCLLFEPAENAMDKLGKIKKIKN